MDRELFNREPDFMVAFAITIPANRKHLAGGLVAYKWRHRGFRNILALLAFQKGLRNAYGDRVTIREMKRRDFR